MKKENIIYVLISIIILILFPVNMLFTVEPYGIFFILSFVLYFFLWIIPAGIIIKSKIIKNKSLSLLLLLLINIVFYAIFLFFATKHANNNQIIIGQVIRDNVSISNNGKIKDILKHENKFEFKNLKNFNRIYNSDIEQFKYCIYLSSLNNENGYIYSFKFESQEKKDRYGDDYYLYISKKDYKIDSELIKEIQNVINKECEN